MADIFISYSKADRLLAEQLAAYLETEGWSGWFDRSLTAGDTFRDEIIKELARARAVISVWTETSVKSDWVRAEAGRAKADGKLIPVKTSGLAYQAIPLPFGEMHTEAIEKVQLIRDAVVGLLARPSTVSTGFPLLGASVRSEVLMWFGIVGGAITLFTNLRGVLQLADWARVLVDNWRALAHALWSNIGALFNIAVTADQAIALNCYTFFLALILGTRLAYLTANRRVLSTGVMEAPLSFQMHRGRLWPFAYSLLRSIYHIHIRFDPPQ